MNCPKCGRTYLEGEKFCAHCGTAVQMLAQPEPPGIPQPQAQPKAVPAQPARPAQSQPAVLLSPELTKRISFSSVIVFILGAVATIMWFTYGVKLWSTDDPMMEILGALLGRLLVGLSLITAATTLYFSVRLLHEP